MARTVQTLFVLVLSCCALSAQTPSKAQTQPKKTEAAKAKADVDPLALQVLKAATDPIRGAKQYSFRTVVAREHLGTNGQVITLFSTSLITVQRPDKLHVDFRKANQEVQLLYDAGQVVLFSPKANLYTTLTASKTLDAALDDLQKRDIFLPSGNFLESDPYHSLVDNLTGGYVIGRAVINDETVHHLAFTEPHAEWQLWVIGGDNPRIRRLEVIDKRTAEKLRVSVDFFDWNFSPTVDPAMFKFEKPPEAKEIGQLRLSTEK